MGTYYVFPAIFHNVFNTRRSARKFMIYNSDYTLEVLLCVDGMMKMLTANSAILLSTWQFPMVLPIVLLNAAKK